MSDAQYEQFIDKMLGEKKARIAALEAALTEIRDLLPIEQDNYSRRVFAIAADALETPQ
jgi:hypothetical protein